MIDVIQENLDTSIAIATLFISALVIFLGLGESEKNKQEQLKFILISYTVIILLVLFYTNVSTFIFGILLLFFFLGGLSFSTNGTFGLEKELNSIELLWYSSVSWFFITNNYFLYMSIMISYAFRFEVYISLAIISISLILQYLAIVKDYFGINTYKVTFEELEKINLYARNNKRAEDVLNSEFLNEKLQLVAFVLYVEDRYLLDRKKFRISLKNLIDSKRDPVIFKGKIAYQEKSRIDKYKRGYSTIEQQLIRQYSIGNNAYRYKYRRKFFFDWVYTPMFSKALCNRKSRVYGKEKKIAKKELVWSLKLMLLYNYFMSVLKNPKDSEELILNMSRQSRVSVSVYEKMFEIFKDSEDEKNIKEKIKSNLLNKYNFY
ncbi:hypothetical protein DOK76_05610 [Vagococcus sp. DIV0080]|uniref:Uncharacterized protein n=1 Tax=Candidatus Vagococcus giribetii TaxID=2230876 RepID=A0ABS3HTH6_9ENTE|nr:hypothetical protein [Vagococcus sp. DIV0080]MBO0476537.1 hypothetical protein [Vagococcus sp. DIV0080]